jgi:spore coat polysaccharide biosynthesis protein SpsF
MIAAIIQARMGSTRLPGKVLMEVDGVPLLEYQIDRIKQSKMLNKIIVATSILEQDDKIADFCDSHDILCFRGSENDVLERYYDCAKQYKVETVVRLTADCPLIDPQVIDQTIMLFQKESVDYCGNTVPPEKSKYPDGSDVEVFSFQALKKAHDEARSAPDREHVTFYFWKYDYAFTTALLSRVEDWSKYRITVDYPEDLEVVRFVLRQLKREQRFGSLEEIITIIRNNPIVFEKNAKYEFGIGWKK